MQALGSPNSILKPHRQLQPMRFGSQPEAPLTDAEMAAAADLFRRALSQAEGMPGSDNRENSPLEQLLARLVNGSSSLGDRLVRNLQQVITGTPSSRSCKAVILNEGSSPRQAYQVKSGALDKVFRKRTLTSKESQSFDQFLEKKFGKDQRVIISMTGWSKPPVEPLLQNDFYRRKMMQMDKSQWPKFAEEAYVVIIKEFLNDVIANLKKELPHFNPVTDLGIIYGVTPEGVDRGIQEYCLDKSIPIAGLTCYDWAQYIPDENGLPDVFIADNAATFGKLMADSSNKIVVSGGRSFAADVKLDGEKAAGAERRIPVDLFASYAGVSIPAIVAGDDEMTAKILNAAALTKAMGVDPWYFDVVEKAKNGRQTDNPDEFATTHILKKELERLYQIRSINAELLTTP